MRKSVTGVSKQLHVYQKLLAQFRLNMSFGERHKQNICVIKGADTNKQFAVSENLRRSTESPA